MTCAYCGAALPEGAVYCRHCERAQPGLRGAATGAVPGAPALVEPPATERVSVPTRTPDAAPASRRTTRPTVRIPASARATSAREAGRSSGREAPAAAAEPALPVAPVAPAASDASDASVAPVASGSAAPRPLSEPLLPVPDIPERPPVAPPSSDPVAPAVPPRIVLQFSTGESLIVRGDGIIGRNPAAEPGEVIDQLIPLADSGRSVSKNHAAFGVRDGRFWVSDRWSTNGTFLRVPGEPPQRCVPGHRYLLEPGTRVDIGDQFFVIG